MRRIKPVILTLCVNERIGIMNLPKDRVVVASDVNPRDGVGVEIYRDNKLVVEIFRDDTKRTREIFFFKESISLELMEEETVAIHIPWEFIEYE